MSQQASAIEVGQVPLPAVRANRIRSRPLTNPKVLTVAFLLLPMLTLIFFRTFMSGTDTDYWWHLRTGQYIFETGTIPNVDLFSYTVPDHPWVAHEWLTELMLYLVYRQFGYVANVALFGLISASIWLVVYVTCRWRGIGQVPAAIMVGWSFVIATMSIAAVRPQMFTALFLSIGVMLLTRYKQGHVRSLWLIPPLFVLWVNLHGGYVIGLLLLGLTIAGELVGRLSKSSTAPLKPLLVAASLSFVATVANPNGLQVLLYPFSYVGSGNASMHWIAEWQSPDFHEGRFLIYGASLLLVFVLGVGRKPLGATETLWLVTFALMSLQSARHIPLYAIVATPLICARLQTEIPVLRNTLEMWRRPGLLVVLWIAVLGSVFITLATPERRNALQLGFEPSAAEYPSGAVEYLRTHELQGNLFNEYDWGGYLIYKLYPERRVFIDGRADVYGDQFVEDYVAVSRLRTNWRQFSDKYDLRLALVNKESSLAAFLAADSNWQELYSGKIEQIFARQSP